MVGYFGKVNFTSCGAFNLKGEENIVYVVLVICFMTLWFSFKRRLGIKTVTMGKDLYSS